MKCIKNGNELVLRDKPGWNLLFAMFFAVIGVVFLVGALGGFNDFGAIRKFAFLTGAFAVAVVLWCFVSKPVSEIVINEQTKTVSHGRRGLFKKSDKIYEFSEVAKFSVKRGEDEDNRPIWRVELNLTSGETIEITSVWNRNEIETQSVADSANNFLRK